MSEETPRATAASSEAPPVPPMADDARKLTALLNGASAFVLAAAACVVLITAAPTLVRTVLPRGRSVSASGDADHLLPPRRDEEPSHPSGGFVFAPDDERDRTRSTDEAPDSHLIPRFNFGSEPGAEAPSAASAERAGSVRMGRARRTLKLHVEPDDDGMVLGEIKAGEQVVIIKEAGLWALVYQTGHMGWTRKSELAVR